jgi:phage terminase large subunit-like protein
MLKTLDDYRKLIVKLRDCPDSDKVAITRYLCRTDLFFLLWYGCNRKDMQHHWLIDRCKEVQAQPDNCLDLWARGHYKSTIITFGKTLQDILASHGDDPIIGYECTFGIFSCTRPIAKGFLRQIKRELESNELLKRLFPDVIWENAEKEAPKWSEDDGLVLKRKGNPKESTIEAWGVVVGQPTSKHFTHLVFDDLVTIEYVRSPEMIAKTTESLGLADNLGSKNYKTRFIGTRYHFNDTYRDLINKADLGIRKYPCTSDGTFDGEPVLLTRAELDKKRRKQGPYIFACQMLLNPVADSSQAFKREWICFHDGTNGDGMNIYILVDPANEKKKTSDYTAIEVVGLAPDNNYYTLELIRDRLNLTERGDMLFNLHRKWRPLGVGYEKYGMQADVSYMHEKMRREHYNFVITELGGSLAKNDRIKKLIPVFEQRRWYLPKTCYKTNYEGVTLDLVEVFLSEEYDCFPVPIHDDMFDCKARILDEKLNAMFPRVRKTGTSHARVHTEQAWMV